MKELYIIRHAKSSWDNPSLSDFDRPLNSRGERDAPLMGKVLADQKIIPDLIYSSTANRALTTAKTIADKLGVSNEIVLRKDFYHASESQLLQQINSFDNKANRVFMFGHNPGFTYLAENLTTETFGSIPTCGVVGIRFPFDSWDFVSAETGDVIMYDYPKNHL